jgi:hypothetical protein
MEPIVVAARAALEELSQALAMQDPHDVRFARQTRGAR